MPSPLYARYRTVAQDDPHAPAVTFLRSGTKKTVTYRYDELFDRVERLASDLADRDINRLAPLGLLLRSQEDQVLHYLAALHADLVPAVLTPPNRKLHSQYYQETTSAVLRRCAFGAVISDVDGMDLPTRQLAPFTLVERDSSAVIPPTDPATDREPLVEASFLQFSSGTTGIKRGVVVTDEAVLSQLDTYAAALGLTRGDVILGWLPLYHDMGFIACLNMPLAHGVHTVMIDPIDWVADPGLYLRAVSDFRATVSWHPNFAFMFMAQRVRESDLTGVDVSSLRALINCSEPVTHESQQAFQDRYRAFGLAPDVFKGCYAMAETTFALTHGEPNDADALDPRGPEDGTAVRGQRRYVSVGRPLPNVELRVTDPQSGDTLPERCIGEIWARSPFTFSGYYNDPVATDRSFVDGWYRTGDLGYRVNDAYFVVGRLKDVMIVGGVNVFPQDIEELVSTIDGVQAGRVSSFSTFDPRVQTERVVILAESERHGTEQELRVVQTIRQLVLAAFQIANFQVDLVPSGWLVKSTSGKMARGRNRDKWLENRRHD